MTPERWRQIEELYQAVLEQEPDRRDAFLQSACGEDRDLLREVESLLATRGQGQETATVVTVPPPVPALMGQQLGHCQVLSLLGKGGMGEVYLARDTQLDRQVALKVLPLEVTQDPERLKRFVREAKAASALNHPNIATIYELGEAKDVHFILMEYVKGETLEVRIREHRFELAEILDIGIQVADALEEAHRQGITHRDIKPANIMLTPRGQVKVLDFGLAKRTRPETPGEGTATLTASQTTPGVIMGTLQYMAPEQLLGQPADARSDLWALGVVLYEMAAGERPFQGQTAFELSSAILNQVPRPLPTHAPAELKALIERCLEKSPDGRYQQAGDVRAALKAVQVGAEPAPVAPRYWRQAIPIVSIMGRWREWIFGKSSRIRLLAVLPFQNLSGDPEQEYFADGMTEELITDLSRIRSLKVISRTSAMRYKRSNKPLPQIARELNADGIVEGSVQRSAEQVCIRVQLIRAATDTPIWSERYERSFSDVLTLQGEVAQTIAREINAVLTPETANQLARVRPINPEAYEAYLKGQFHWYRLSPGDLDLAWSYFQSALTKDPTCAPAYVGAANVWFMRSDTGILPPSEGFSRAREAVQKALALDESLAVAHIVLGNILAGHDRNWVAGEREFRRALELDPNNAFGHQMYADFLIAMKRPKEWEVEARRALELDPFSPFFQLAYGWELVYVGRYDEAIQHLHKVLITEPNSSSARLGLWGAYYRKEMYAEALAEAKRHFEIIHEPEVVNALVSGFKEGGYQRAMSLGAAVFEAESQRRYIPGVRLARMYAHAGDNDRALYWLSIAFERRETPLYRLAVFWDWDNLRPDPRFQDLLRRMNLPL
jgi:serine/threonine protein kinase